MTPEASSLKRVVLITGASAGFGKACAEHLGQRGFQVYGTSRSACFDADSPSKSQKQPSFFTIPMDVRDTTSVETGIRYILDKEEHIDIVVNNAGFGLAGAFEDCSVEEIKGQFETNVFGVVRVCQSLIPHMRKRKQGVIVIVGSLAGRIGIPFQSAYSASKFALEGFAESLRMEVKPFGIQVVLIEPGDFKTHFTRNRMVAEKSRDNSIYTPVFKRAVGVMENDEQNGPPPADLAHLLEKILQTPSPALRYPAGKMPSRLAVKLKAVLPGKVFEWLVMKAYKLH